MNTFTIKDLESLSGVKAHTIRIWEQRYSFLKPSRTQTNIRYYSNDELVKLLNIALLNKYGFKISHIDKMQQEEIRQKLVSLSSAEAHAERAVNRLIELMVTMDVFSFETELDQYIKAKGIDKTVSQLIFPFLEKIGILWVTSHINPAQEHLVSNIIRQKIVMGIENARPLTLSEKSVLLFLPETEYHELALLYLHYVLKSKGYRIYYIGANIPSKDLAFIVEHKKPDVLYTHLTSPAKNFNAGRYFKGLFDKHPHTKMVIGGSMGTTMAKQVPNSVKIARSSEDVFQYLQAFLFN